MQNKEECFKCFKEKNIKEIVWVNVKTGTYENEDMPICKNCLVEIGTKGINEVLGVQLDSVEKIYVKAEVEKIFAMLACDLKSVSSTIKEKISQKEKDVFKKELSESMRNLQTYSEKRELSKIFTQPLEDLLTSLLGLY
ncbi:MAG: hypothetical protein ACOCQR_03080 [bacterium]